MWPSGKICCHACCAAQMLNAKPGVLSEELRTRAGHGRQHTSALAHQHAALRPAALLPRPPGEASRAPCTLPHVWCDLQKFVQPGSKHEALCTSGVVPSRKPAGRVPSTQAVCREVSVYTLHAHGRLPLHVLSLLLTFPLSSV